MFDGGGLWVIFPILGLIFMFLMMSRMFGFGRRSSGRGMGMGSMCMGMSDEHEQESEGNESALDVLRRRYAAGEITDEQFEAIRRKLKEP